MGGSEPSGLAAAAEDDIRLQRPGPKRFNLRSSRLGWWGRFPQHWQWHRGRTYVVRVKVLLSHGRWGLAAVVPDHCGPWGIRRFASLAPTTN